MSQKSRLWHCGEKKAILNYAVLFGLDRFDCIFCGYFIKTPYKNIHIVSCGDISYILSYVMFQFFFFFHVGLCYLQSHVLIQSQASHSHVSPNTNRSLTWGTLMYTAFSTCRLPTINPSLHGPSLMLWSPHLHLMAANICCRKRPQPYQEATAIFLL